MRGPRTCSGAPSKALSARHRTAGPGLAVGPTIKKWHNEGTNAVHVDGHAKWYKFGSIWMGNSTWNGTEWGGDAANIKYWSVTGS